MKPCASALAMCCALPLLVAGAQAAPAMRTHRSAHYHYSLTYPANWTHIGVQGADFAAVAPDHNGFVTVSAARGTAQAATLRHALARAFAAFGQPQGAPDYRSLNLHGAAALLARDLVTASDGKTGAVLAVALSRHKLIYTILGVVTDTAVRSANADAESVLAIIEGARFF